MPKFSITQAKNQFYYIRLHGILIAKEIIIRHIKEYEVENLTYAGYVSSFFAFH